MWDTLIGHSCETLLWDTVAGHSCGTFLWDTHTGHSCGTLYLGHSCRTLLWVTLVGSSCGALFRTLLIPQNIRLPATRRVYASMLLAPQWHGATQTHSPPRPRKSQRHCNITNVTSPHRLPTHLKQTYHMIPQNIPLTSDAPRLRQPVSRSPVAQRHARKTDFSPRPRKSKGTATS